MGAALQKEANSPNRVQMEFQDATPPRESWNLKRQLILDPRSPTDEIFRTPIIVDQTPSSLDPRSPTVDLERTPVMLFLGKDIAAEPDMSISGYMEGETTLAATTTELSPPLCWPEACGVADMKTPQKVSCSPDPDQIPGIPDIDADDGMTTPLTSNILGCSSVGNTFCRLTDFATVEPSPLQMKPVPLPKQLFPNAKQPLSIKQPLAPRSPLALATVDINSPRIIVQAKQRQQVTKSLGGMRARNIVDKENLAH